MARQYKYRVCHFCGKPGTTRSVKPTNWMDPTAPWAHPACWQKKLEEETAEARERQRQAHLAIRNYWVDSSSPPIATDEEVPGSGAYNAKHGFDR